MKNLKSLTEIVVFIENVLGKPAAQMFDENMEDYVYFVRSEALNDTEITESRMRSKLRKFAEGIIAASVKHFLNENYADDYGDVELNVNEDGVFDKNMKRIDEIEQIRKTQREITSLMVSRGMYEFAKGRHLARIMDSRSRDSKLEPSPKDANWMPTQAKFAVEQTEIEIIRLERMLPNIKPEHAKRLGELYASLKSNRRK